MGIRGLRPLAAALLLLALLLTLLAPPAGAQFIDQATWAGTAGGSANAQTVTVPNVSTLADVQGVLLKWVPVAANTGSATLAVTGTTPTIIRKPGASGLAALTGGPPAELQVGQPVITMYDGTQHVLLSAVNDNVTVTSASLGNSALGFGFATNLQLNGSVAANQLTLAVKGNNGSDPSATNPVLVSFRDVTIANGDPVVRSLQAALSFTINSGNTMGCVSNQMCRLWVVAIDNAGTVALCAFNALSGTSVAAINEAALQTSQAGTAGGSSAQLYYCNLSAVTARAIRILGYVDVQEAVAGTWATLPTYVQLFGPGIKRPGDTVQSLIASTSTFSTASTSSYIPSNTTITTAAGTNPVSQAVTPTSAANVLRITGQAMVGSTGSATIQAYAFITVGAGATSVATGAVDAGQSTTIPSAIPVLYQVVAGGTAAVTYRLWVSAGQATDPNVNGAAGAAQAGGTFNTYIRVDEIMGALDPPANDNFLLSAAG